MLVFAMIQHSRMIQHVIYVTKQMSCKSQQFILQKFINCMVIKIIDVGIAVFSISILFQHIPFQTVQINFRGNSI